MLGAKYLEASARQPELMETLRSIGRQPGRHRVGHFYNRRLPAASAR